MPFYATARNPAGLEEICSVAIGILLSSRSGMVSDGIALDEDFEKMIEEINQMKNDEGAFAMCFTFLAIGKVE